MSLMNATAVVSMTDVKASGSSRSKSEAKSHSSIESMPVAGVTARYFGQGRLLNNSQYCR